DGHAEPYVIGHLVAGAVALANVARHRHRPLGQHLIDGAIVFFHRVEALVAEAIADLLVHQVAHRVDEHAARHQPPALVDKRLEPAHRGDAILVANHFREILLPTLLHDVFGVAVFAAGRDLRATRRRVPRRIGPADVRLHNGHTVNSIAQG